MTKRLLTLFIGLAISLGSLGPNEASAKLLQIIHTNDLHSHLEHSSDPERGGYAAVKAVIDRLKLEAEANGIDTLVLDGGDFTEGSQFFLADRGAGVWKAMSHMGYDAVVFGNHDWLLGPDDLDRALGEAKPTFSLLGANFFFNPMKKNLSQYVKPYAEFNRSGVKIAVLGLTTSDILYSWRNDEGFISEPILQAGKYLPKLKENNDVVIALTHIGIMKDYALAVLNPELDIVVGGHSHTQLNQPAYVLNTRGHKVPIVQTGEHGNYVGDFLVDVEAGKPVEVLRYQLIPVYSNGAKDPAMEEVVQQTRAKLEADYGKEWLNEVVGQSEVKLSRPGARPSNAWSSILMDSMKEEAHADLAIDANTFIGVDHPAGPVTREALFKLYPRVFDFNDRFGWTIWTTHVRGASLHLALQEMIRFGLPIIYSGVTWEIKYKKKIRLVTDLKINGKKINPLKNYRVATSEGIARGAYEISPLFRVLLKGSRNTRIPIWTATERKIRKMGIIHRDYSNLSGESHSHDDN